MEITKRLAAVFGLLGPLLLVAYFVAPFLLSWPLAGGTPDQLTAYALKHQTTFYAGAWLQTTGTLLCVVFFVALVRLARVESSLAGMLVLVGSACLLTVVVIESALTVAVPIAAADGDAATVSTTFTLVNGVFVRVFPLAPSSATYIALGLVLLSSDVVHRWFGYAALAIGIAFEIAGAAAVFVGAIAIVLAVLGVGQAIWVISAAVALWRSADVAIPVSIRSLLPNMGRSI
jgi:hypothetical protein